MVGHPPPPSRKHSRPLTYALLTMALAMFAAALVYNIWRLERGNEALLASAGESAWQVFQAEFELQRLLYSLERHALGEASETDAELRKRFDIFWSRLPLMIAGEHAILVREASRAEEVLPEFLATLERLAPLLDRVRGDPARFRDVRAALEAMQGPLREISLATLHEVARRHTLLREELAALARRNNLSLAGLVGSIAILLFLLHREVGHTRFLLARSHLQERRVRHLAHHDMLTGLPNRRLFEERLREMLRRPEPHRRRVGLLLLDLDHFKAVNDTHGHAVGDALLRAAARRMRTCMRRADMLARMGGDEFAVLQEETEEEENLCLRLAGRLLDAFVEPFELDGRRLRASLSVGIALFPDHARDAAELLRRADLALYRAKAAGRRRLVLFEAEMERDLS